MLTGNFISIPCYPVIFMFCLNAFWGKPVGTLPPGDLAETVARLRGRILVVEDGPDNQRIIRHILERAGCEVALADNGQIGIEMALAACDEDRPYDVIVMDVQMPVIDGYEATRRLRAQGYAGPIVALTAHALATERQRCMAAGCDDFATKPIDRFKLLGVLERHLASRKKVSG